MSASVFHISKIHAENPVIFAQVNSGILFAFYIGLWLHNHFSSPAVSVPYRLAAGIPQPVYFGTKVQYKLLVMSADKTIFFILE